MRAKWFCYAFKLGFLQLTCKTSLISKSNFELALSIIWKERELYKSKHAAVECRCIKIWDLLSFLISCSILVLKWQPLSSINENEYYKLYPPGRIYGTPKMDKFFSSDSFPKLCEIVSSIGTFDYILVHFLCKLLSTLVPNDYSCKDVFFFCQIKNANLSKKNSCFLRCN